MGGERLEDFLCGSKAQRSEWVQVIVRIRLDVANEYRGKRET